MGAKYQALEDFLKSRPASDAHVTLSFQDIEKLTGQALPSSAYQHRAWWSNQADLSNRPQARAWRNAGFTVESVSSSDNDGHVSFSREGTVPRSASLAGGSDARRPKTSVSPVAAKRREAIVRRGKTSSCCLALSPSGTTHAEPGTCTQVRCFRK